MSASLLTHDEAANLSRCLPAPAYCDDIVVVDFGSIDEVIEHLFNPRLFARRMFDLVKPGGMVVVSTPYHGYWKNLALAASGKLDTHFTALWDGGHVKFWSMKTLRILLADTGFVDIRFERAGRIPVFAKSMIAIAKRAG